MTGFKGWATGAGLKDALEEWSLQVKSLQGRLANDRSSLQEAKKSYLLNDVHTGNDLLRLGGPQSQGRTRRASSRRRSTGRTCRTSSSPAYGK